MPKIIKRPKSTPPPPQPKTVKVLPKPLLVKAIKPLPKTPIKSILGNTPKGCITQFAEGQLLNDLPKELLIQFGVISFNYPVAQASLNMKFVLRYKGRLIGIRLGGMAPITHVFLLGAKPVAPDEEEMHDHLAHELIRLGKPHFYLDTHVLQALLSNVG
jgi:hypothetical protein